MQPKMRDYPLQPEEVDALLTSARVGRLGVIYDGRPYVVPLHFVYHGGAIYVHGRPQGQKTDAIRQNPQVCFEVDEMARLVMPKEGKNPCSVGTQYQSVIIQGKAALVDDFETKKKALSALVAKYTPDFSGEVMPDAAVRATMVVRIDVETRTGKFHP